MTKLDKMTDNEIWAEIEECFYSIEMDVGSRCYAEHSTNGARHIQGLVRQSLAWIDRALLEIEVRAQKADKVKAEQVLQRVEEGMTTAADAEFLRKLLCGLLDADHSAISVADSEHLPLAREAVAPVSSIITQASEKCASRDVRAFVF